MDMPIRVFWVFNANIHKLNAEKDIRALSIAVSCQSSEGTKSLEEKLLRDMMGREAHIVSEAQRDEAGFAELKSIIFSR